MNLPIKTPKKEPVYSLRLSDELKTMQLELKDNNIDIPRLLRDTIYTAWCQMKGTDPEWTGEK